MEGLDWRLAIARDPGPLNFRQTKGFFSFCLSASLFLSSSSSSSSSSPIWLLLLLSAAGGVAGFKSPAFFFLHLSSLCFNCDELFLLSRWLSYFSFYLAIDLWSEGLRERPGRLQSEGMAFFFFFFVNYYHHDYYYHLFIYSDGLAGPLILCQFAGSNRWADNDWMSALAPIKSQLFNISTDTKDDINRMDSSQSNGPGETPARRDTSQVRVDPGPNQSNHPQSHPSQNRINSVGAWHRTEMRNDKSSHR